MPLLWRRQAPILLAVGIGCFVTAIMFASVLVVLPGSSHTMDAATGVLVVLCAVVVGDRSAPGEP